MGRVGLGLGALGGGGRMLTHATAAGVPAARAPSHRFLGGVDCRATYDGLHFCYIEPDVCPDAVPSEIYEADWSYLACTGRQGRVLAGLRACGLTR